MTDFKTEHHACFEEFYARINVAACSVHKAFKLGWLASDLVSEMIKAQSSGDDAEREYYEDFYLMVKNDIDQMIDEEIRNDY